MSRKLGTGMMTIAWVLIFGLGVVAIDEWLAKRENPNQHPAAERHSDGSRTVTLRRNPQHHYLVNASVNGQTVTLLVDTGATDVVLPEQLANKLGLPRLRSGIAQTAGGPVKVYSTVIDEIRIGDIVLRNIAASINPGMPEGMPALLGMSALKNIELVHRDGELILKQT